ncbi:hypothetical protein BHE74_00010457 [Ensete ventricosum]|nr:hypothetical protein BHE74_00010457 [Ensete ventricosum]
MRYVVYASETCADVHIHFPNVILTFSVKVRPCLDWKKKDEGGTEGKKGRQWRNRRKKEEGEEKERSGGNGGRKKKDEEKVEEAMEEDEEVYLWSMVYGGWRGGSGSGR